MMEKLDFSVVIDSPREKVWHAMLDDQTYREWTSVFSPDSHYEGEWREGAKMLFLGTDPESGTEAGMVSRVKAVKPYECVSVENLGIVANGEEDTTSEEARKWTPSLERYSFRETPGGTEVSIDVEVESEHKEMFEEMWPKALTSLKQIAER